MMIDGYCVIDCNNEQLHSDRSTCVACTTNNTIKAHTNSLSQELECTAKCGSIRTMYNGYCAKKYCNPDANNNNGYFHRSSDGQCFACNSDDKVPVTGTSERSECTACGNREVYNGKCVKKCNTGYFHTTDGACVACSSDTEGLVSTADDIAVCTGNDKRFIDDNGITYKCSISTSVSMTGDGSITSCNACTERTYNAGTSTCDKN